ncbi:hypothetical protein [Tissierella simiarum]|uniref:hypothetical protein n=1 Tax=Tissierella simiarum TaxID=2841534 RepID=UPI001FED1B94|nr:hypothetical protein [Tissierella simiarum]
MGQSATIDREIKNYELKLREVDLNKSRLENETWYFSIVDVISILTDSNEPRRYWSDLKIKLKNEGNELYDKIV